MWLAIALQAAQFLPAPAPEPVGPDLAYLARVESAAQAESWQEAELADFAPRHPSQYAALTQYVYRAEATALRFTARIAAGSKHDGLNRAFFHRATLNPESSTSLACLLAPDSVPSGCHAALLVLMHDSQQSLTRRAGAAARLLDSDVPAAAEWAMALFASGTELDRNAPAWADWRRGSRWELTKRVTLLSFNDWLERNGAAASAFEPNAAWAVQAEVLRELGPVVGNISAQAQAQPKQLAWAAWNLHQESIRRLQAAADQGQVAAQRALTAMPGWQLR